VPGIFPGRKGSRCYGWQPYHLHVLIGLKSGSLNFLEPSGPVQACNGIDLPLPLVCKYINVSYCDRNVLIWGTEGGLCTQKFSASDSPCDRKCSVVDCTVR
jgi:hypothetical protein